jgi:hypothetical protein
MKCKNIECNNETIGKKVYCSLSCRNIYVNKYLRDYTKYKETCENKKKEREVEYLKNPKHCKNCGNIIKFDSENESFCNHSCSASFTNGKRDYSKWSDKISDGLFNYFVSIGVRNKDDIKGIYKLKCNECQKDFDGYNNRLKFCSKECKNKNIRGKSKITEYKAYKNDTNFKFNLADYPEEFDFSLIEKYGWYSPKNKKNNLNGISRDHMLSVREGFELGVNPEIVSHPANCELMIHRDNISKNKKSSLTLEELLERIKNFEEKYKK